MKFIVFEGLDGSGKTTLIKKLAEELSHKNISYVQTREPGGSKLGDELRHMILRTTGEAPVPRAELLMYEAARAQHVDILIRPSLAQNKWVLCDRFSASSLAFQAGGRKISESAVEWLNAFATDNLTPDLTVLLDLTVEESEKRRASRNEASDRMEQENKEFHERIRQNFLKQARENSSKWLVLDASLSPEQLHTTLLNHLRGFKWLA